MHTELRVSVARYLYNIRDMGPTGGHQTKYGKRGSEDNMRVSEQLELAQ